MLTIESITDGVAHINIDVDGTNYAWTVGGLADVADVQSHLEANANAYRQDIRTALAMGRTLDVIPAPTLADVLAVKTSAIQAEKCRVRDAGFLVDGVLFDSDQAAQISYLELAAELAADASYTVPWKASELTWVTMTAAMYAKVKSTGTEHIRACFAWQKARDAELATVKSAVAAGTISTPDAMVAVAAVSTTYTAEATS